MIAFIATTLGAAAWAQAHLISPEYTGNCQAPTWSRDGSKLAYEVNYHDKKSIDLYVYEPGRNIRQVLPMERDASLTSGYGQAQPTQVAHQPVWSPPSIGRLIYSSSSTQMDFDLYLERAGALTHAKGSDGDPTWSNDGRWLVFTSARTGQGDLYVLDLFSAGSPPIQLTTDSMTAELDPIFALNDQRLLYVAHTDNGDDIHLISDIHDPKPEAVTTLSRSQVKPSWSPDGQHIAFYSNHVFLDRNDLYVMKLGSTPYPVAQGVLKNHLGPSWTPDSKNIVYVMEDSSSFNPIQTVPIHNPDLARAIPSETVGNGDIDIVKGTDGRIWLAIAAQGRVDDPVRDFKRIYVMPLPEKENAQ